MRILLLATVRYCSLRQRPQQLASRLGAVYASPVMFPFNARRKWMRALARALAPLRHVWGWIYYRRYWDDWDMVIAQSSLFYPIVRHMRCPVIYDRIDNEAGFCELPGSVEAEIEKMQHLCFCSVSAPALLVGPGRVIPNGVDDILWRNRIQVVYHGVIDWWFDVELVAECATLLPDVVFLLIGPIKTDVGALRDLSNVHFVGGVDHSLLPVLLKGADMAIIPFKINDLTRSVDPVKFYEYKRLGIPMLATPFRAIEGLPYAFRYEFPQVLANALRERFVVSDGHVRTWDETAAEMKEFIGAVYRFTVRMNADADIH